MAISGKKISVLNNLSELTGNEYLLVSYKGKSYKIPTSFLIGNVLTGITQTRNDGDSADNPVTITTSDGTAKVFHIYNGKQGSKGPRGDKGEQGDPGATGIALYNMDYNNVLSKIVAHLEDTSNLTEEQLTQLILSAAAGKELAEKIEKLKEVYLDSEEQYEELVARNEIDDNTKYFIFEE